MSAEAHMRGMQLADVVKMESIDFHEAKKKAKKKLKCCFTPWNN